MAYWLIRKSKRAVCNDPVVKYGFARGTEQVGYVELILDRFEHDKVFVKEEGEEGESGLALAPPDDHASWK